MAHVLASTDMRFRVMFGRLVRSGFNLDSTLSKMARELGELPQAELVASLRARAGFRFVPPGAKPINLMADTVVHSQDIRRPLGMRCSVEASTLLAAASFLAVNNFNCKSATQTWMARALRCWPLAVQTVCRSPQRLAGRNGQSEPLLLASLERRWASESFALGEQLSRGTQRHGRP